MQITSSFFPILFGWWLLTVCNVEDTCLFAFCPSLQWAGLSYLLHALQCLLQEAELLLAGGILLLCAWELSLALLLLQQLHLIPIGV